MSKVSITKSKLDNLANAVAAKSGIPVLLSVDEMTDAVLGISVGEENILEGVKVNGIELPIINKKVNIPVVSSNQAGVITPGIIDGIYNDFYTSNLFVKNTYNNAITSTINTWDESDSCGKIQLIRSPYNTTAYITYGADTNEGWIDLSADKIELHRFGSLTSDSILIKSDLANVAFSGQYSDLINQPVIVDEKLAISQIPSNDLGEYVLILGTSSTTSASTRSYDLHLKYKKENTSDILIIGSNNSSDFKSGKIVLRNFTTSGATTIQPASGSTSKTITLPGVSGTVALTSDIPAIPTNVSSFTNDAGYLTSYTETDPTVPSWAKQSSKPTYTANEVGALPDSTVIPTKTSDLTNDSGYLTSYTETDPTVPSWAKASSKPTYTFSELTTHPTSISGYGITDAYTKSEVDSKVSAVLKYKGVKATIGDLPSTGNTTGDTWHVTATSGEYAWDGTEWQELGTAISIPANTGSSTTGISIANHSTDSIYGVSSSTTSVYGVSTSTTTASKVTVGSSSTDYGVTAAGSGNASLTFTMDTTDTKKLKISFTHTHTAPTLGSKVPTVSASDVTVPIKNADATTVPIKNAGATTVVTSATHSVTDTGHTHTI